MYMGISAGKLEFSESLEQCAIREKEEETGIKVKKIEIHWLS